MLTVTCWMAEVAMRHVYSTFAVAFVLYSIVALYSRYNQLEKRITYPTIIPSYTLHVNGLSNVFTPSISRIRPVAMAYQTYGLWQAICIRAIHAGQMVNRMKIQHYRSSVVDSKYVSTISWSFHKRRAVSLQTYWQAAYNRYLAPGYKSQVTTL